MRKEKKRKKIFIQHLFPFPLLNREEQESACATGRMQAVHRARKTIEMFIKEKKRRNREKEGKREKERVLIERETQIAI